MNQNVIPATIGLILIGILIWGEIQERRGGRKNG